MAVPPTHHTTAPKSTQHLFGDFKFFDREAHELHLHIPEIVSAVLRNDLNEVQFWIHHTDKYTGEGIDINEKDHEGFTALMRAALLDRTKCLKTLLDAGVDRNITNNDGETALMLACYAGHFDIVHIMLNFCGANDIMMPNIVGVNAFLISVSRGHMDIIMELLHHRADVNYQTPFGLTALMLAASKDVAGDYTEVVEALLEAEADINLKESLGQTALMVAANNNAVQSCYLLLDYGADPNEVSKGHGRRNSLQRGSPETQKALLEYTKSEGKGKKWTIGYDNVPSWVTPIGSRASTANVSRAGTAKRLENNEGRTYSYNADSK